MTALQQLQVNVHRTARALYFAEHPDDVRRLANEANRLSDLWRLALGTGPSLPLTAEQEDAIGHGSPSHLE